MNCFRKSYLSCFAVFLVIAFVLTNSGYTSVYSNSATQEAPKGMRIDRIHPLHVDLLNVTEQVKNDVENKKAVLLKLLNDYAPVNNKKQTKEKLSQISTETANLKNSYYNIYQKIVNTIKELKMKDIRSDRYDYYFLINIPLEKVDKNGDKISGGTNNKYLEKIEEDLQLLVTIDKELNDFEKKIKNLIDNIGKNVFKSEEYKLQEERDHFYTKTLNAIDEFSRNIEEFSKNVEAFFEVYYNSYLEYNNLTFPYYKNSFCSLYDKEGIYKKNNIQIQCAAVAKEPEESENKAAESNNKAAEAKNKAAEYAKNIEALQNALFLNSELLDKSPPCPGGGIFPRENIRISLAEVDYNKTITDVNFYEIDLDGKLGKENDIKNYKIKYEKSKTRFGKGYIILDRTAIMADYPYGTRPVKVMVEVVFSAKDKKNMETVFVPAYDEGHQIIGEDMMYLNIIRAQKSLHPLQIDDFKEISSNEDSIYYPAPGGYLLELDEEGSVKCAACVDSINKDGSLKITYIKGFECGNKNPKKMETVISGKGTFDWIFGKYKLEEEKVQFKRYALMPLADINQEFTNNMEKLPFAKSIDADDDDVIKSVFGSINIKGRKYLLPEISIDKKTSDLNTFEGVSLYNTAFQNVFKNYEKYITENKALEEEAVNNEYLKYILLNIYDSQNLLSDKPGTDYMEKVEKLKETNIGRKISSNFDLKKAKDDDEMVRALASACFPNEVKKLKLMQGSGAKDEKYWELPLSGNIISLDIPEKVIFDEPSKKDRYLLWGVEEEKKAVYIKNKAEVEAEVEVEAEAKGVKTWHYVLTSKKYTDQLVALTEDFKLTKESGKICEYKISDKLFWQLISKNVKTQISASWYDKLALSPLNELGYLRYRQLPYYYYNASSKGEVFVDQQWEKENITTLNLNKRNIPINKNVKVQFENVKTYLANTKSDMGYSPSFIDKDPEKGLDNHAFGIAVDMKWNFVEEKTKKEKFDAGKSFFWNSFYIEKLDTWNAVKNNFYKKGFLSGAFHGVNSETSIEPNHIEVGSFTEHPIKYLQNGTIISNVDVNEYKINIDKPSLIKINLYNWEGDYDLFLYKETKNGHERVACSTCGIPDAGEENSAKDYEKISKYVDNTNKGTYILRVLGYSKKLCHDKYILDVDIEEKNNSPIIQKEKVIEPKHGNFVLSDFEISEIDDYYNKICDSIIADKDATKKKYSFDKYAKDALERWLPPMPSTNSNSNNWPWYNSKISTKGHNGIDFSAGNDTGRLVRAVEDGKARVIKRYVYDSFTKGYDYQYSVEIVHDEKLGLKTEYTHLIQNSIMVKPGQEGQEVKKGDIIGLLGNTGNTSGSHLHYAIWMGNLNVDPFNRDIFDSKYDSSCDIYHDTYHDILCATDIPEYIKWIKEIQDYSFDPQNFISLELDKDAKNPKDYYDIIQQKREEIRARRKNYKDSLGSESIPKLPQYFEPVINPNIKNSDPIVNISKEGVKLSLPDSDTGKYAVSAFLIASGKGRGSKKIDVDVYHWHYIADIMSFREKNTNGTFQIDWPKGEELERLMKDGDKNNVEYYLKLEVENIELGTSYFHKAEECVNKYIFIQ